MKAVIRFTKPDNKLAILTKFLDIIQGVSQLREHVLTHGILFEPLSKSELDESPRFFRRLFTLSQTATADSLGWR